MHGMGILAKITFNRDTEIVTKTITMRGTLISYN